MYRGRSDNVSIALAPRYNGLRPSLGDSGPATQSAGEKCGLEGLFSADSASSAVSSGERNVMVNGGDVQMKMLARKWPWIAGAVLLVLAMVAPLVRADAPENSMEYSRITAGGGYSEQGDFTLDDSITLNSAAANQTSPKYTISSVKSEGTETSSVHGWNQYR